MLRLAALLHATEGLEDAEGKTSKGPEFRDSSTVPSEQRVRIS